MEQEKKRCLGSSTSTFFLPKHVLAPVVLCATYQRPLLACFLFLALTRSLARLSLQRQECKPPLHFRFLPSPYANFYSMSNEAKAPRGGWLPAACKPTGCKFRLRCCRIRRGSFVCGCERGCEHPMGQCRGSNAWLGCL
jgi:hypothetical protein